MTNRASRARLRRQPGRPEDPRWRVVRRAAAPDGPAQLVQSAIDDNGRLDVLVNKVGAVRIRSEGATRDDVSNSPLHA
jgi:NAD(P)-dependent dehydrogenase (short-subunit alcohol dehydrogenase family)